MSKILVVDDERGIRESLDIFLSDEGHAIDTVANGREALLLLKEQEYDLVLTDVRMPDMNGIVLMKEIKEKMKQPVPVIILTAYGTIQSAVTAVKEGASDFILKPFEIERLREAVNNALKNERKKLEYKLFQQEGKNRYLNLMNQKLDRTVFEMAILHEIGKTINSTLEINKIVSIILEMGRQTLVADKARLFLYNYKEPGIALNISYSTEDARPTHKNDCLDQDAIDWIIWKGEPLLLEDINHQSSLKVKPEVASDLGSLLILPFKRKSRILGAMLLANRAGGRKFTQEDLRFAITLANQASITIENAQLYAELQGHFADTIRALISAVEAKDAYTYGHSDRVTRYTMMIANQLEFSQVELRRLEYLSLLHDIGKIGIEERILRKSTSLSEQEWSIIKNHSVLGASIVEPIKFLEDGQRTIRHHHEWFNGSGYPDGLKENSIPLYSRIIAVADAFDAMTSIRPYRDSLGSQSALNELKCCAGTQFDPMIVEKFVSAYGG